MADVNAEIGVSIDTSNALAQLKALQREIARFHTSVAKSSEAAALAQRDLQKNFLNGVNAIQGFSAELRTVKTTAEGFTDSLERNKFSMREYFRYSMASTKTFGRLFKSELDTVNKVAEESVKRLQTQYIKMGRDANGAMKAIAVMPTKLNLDDFTTKTQIAAQKQALFNQLVKQGSTNLLNFGKNTQWAGRQLMVGFTIPLIGLGTAATRTFMDMETAAIKFKKVYGDLFTATEERNQALDDIQELGRRFTKYGIALSDTVSLAADAAAAGFKGIDLQRQVTEATRLQVLGQIDQQKALETTISLQNAFRLSSQDLAGSINFLNAVENQTVVSLDDITTAIPKAAPIIRELGGDVKDLAFFMAAMKEGGINASEGANALKSGLASLINPTDKARGMLSDFGIDIDAIVNKNAGNVKQTVVDFAYALDDLSNLSRQRAIEQLFGKFQQARLSALFDNVIRDGNQASRVLDLAGTSTEELAALAEQELGITANSAMNKFRKSVEDLKAALVPVGQLFLEIVTPFLENIGNILDKFNDLSAGTKKVIGVLTIGLGAIAPVVLMTVGLFANFVANGIKGLALLRNGYLRLTGQSQILSEQTNFLTVEQQQALAAAASLEQSHMRLQQVFTGEAASVRALISEYQRMIVAQNTAATKFPGMMVPGFKPKGYVDGIVSVPGPKGAGDVVPAMLSPGEAVISEAMNKKYAPLVQGIIADNIPGFKTGISTVEGFLSTRVGRSASGGEKAQVNVPGGYQLGHFAEVIQVTGEELRRLAETQSRGFKDTVERMIASVNGDLEHMFDVFTNEVTVQSRDLNQALGEIGSGRTAPVSMFREESVFQAGAYNAPLIRQMEKAGASTEEVDSAVRQLASEFEAGITELGTATEITAEEVNAITQRAYDNVAQVNEKVRIAREKLQDPGAIKEIVGVTSGRTPFKGGYNTKSSRTEINEVVQGQVPGLYPTQQAFNFTGEAARKVGVQNAIAIREIYTQLSTEAQQRVRALIGDIDALSQQVVLEAKNSGIDIGRYAIQGITTGIDAASPSQKARQQGQNVADGFEQGILEGMDDASLAGQRLGNAATKGLGIGDIASGMRVGPGAVSNVKLADSTSNLAESMDDLDSVTIQAADATAQSKAGLYKWNDRMMALSFSMSAASGIASMFGAKMGGLSEKIFTVTSALFALQAVVQVLTQTKLLEIAATRLAAAKQASAFATYGTGMASRSGIAGMLGRVGVFARTLLGLTNPVGWIITGLTVAAGLYVVWNRHAQNNIKKINGLGDAALVAGKKLETLEQFFGTDFRRFTSEGFKYNAETAAGPGLVAARRQQAEALIANKDFQKEFKDTIDALRNATTSEARLVLEGISMQLQARGATKEQIQTITDALIKEAGKTDIVLDFAKIDIKTKEGQAELKKNVDQVLKAYNKAFAKGINDSYKKTLNLAGKSIAGAFGALQLQLEDGTISAKEYADQINNINKQILNMPDSQAKLNLVNAVFDAMGEDAAKAAAGVTNLNNKLLLAQAIMLGVADAQAIKNLSSPLFFVQDVAARTLSANINKYFKQLTSGLEDLNTNTDNNNDSNGKGITLQEKLIKIYQDQVKGLEKKLKALRDVNEEIDRQNQFMKDQVDLDKQITEAKISGNYLEAAALTQQKLYNQAEFNRETQEIAIQKEIDQINDRISYLEDKGKKAQLTAAEKKLLGLETKAKAKANAADDKKKKDLDKKKKENADAGTSVTTTITTTKSASGSPDQAKNDYENRPGNRKIPSPPPVKTGTKDYYFNTKTGKWELITRSSKTPAGYVSRQDYAKGKNTYASGGLIKGPGTGTSDSIFAMVNGYASGGMIRVSNGEYIFSKKAIDNAGGPKAIDAMHQRLKKAPAFRDGGLVGKSQPGDMANLDGQMIRINRGTQKQILADIRAAYAAEPSVKAFKDRIDYFQAIKEWNDKYSFVIPSQNSYPMPGGDQPLGSLSRFISVAKSQAAGGSYNAFYDATLASHAFKSFNPQVDRQVKDLLDSAPNEVFNRLTEIEDLNKFSMAANKTYKLGNDLISWCGAFVAWVAEQSGVNISKKMFSAFSATQEYKDLGTFKDPGSSLNVGDVVWWDWAKKFAAGSSKYKDATPGVPDHVDIITDKIGKSTFTTVGGGFGGSVGKRNINFSKEAQALYGSVTPAFQSFKDGGEVKKQNWFQRYVSKLSSTQDQMPDWARDPLGMSQILRKFTGQGRKGDKPGLMAALLPLNFIGSGIGKPGASILSKLSRIKTAGMAKGPYTGFDNGKMGVGIPDTANAFDDFMYQARTKIGLLKETNPFALRGLSKDTIQSINAKKKDIVDAFDKKKWEWYYKNFEVNGKPLYTKANVIQQKINVGSRDFDLIKKAKAVDAPIGNITSALEYITFPRLAADAMAQVTQRKEFGKAAGAFYRGLSMHDMASIAGYTRMPHTNLLYGKNWMDKFGYTETTTGSPWSGLASRWKKNAQELLAGKKEPAFGTEESLPYLDLNPALQVGQTWLPDTIKSITPNLDWAKEIAVSGGTGGGMTQAIAKIIVDPKVKGIANLQSILAGHKAHGMFPEYTEGVIAPYTKYILESINRGAHHITDDKAGISRLIDEYVFKAVETIPRPPFLQKSKFPELPIVPKMAMGGYINMASLPKFKNGIDNVPYDMPAMLHKNERVLTAEENRAYGQNNSTINAVFNITGGNSDEIVNKVMVKLNTLNNKNNKSNKVVF